MSDDIRISNAEYEQIASAVANLPGELQLKLKAIVDPYRKLTRRVYVAPSTSRYLFVNEQLHILNYQHQPVAVNNIPVNDIRTVVMLHADGEFFSDTELAALPPNIGTVGIPKP